MKRLVLAMGAALLLVGCNQGGSNDNYGTGAGKESSTTNKYNNNSGGANPGADNQQKQNPPSQTPADAGTGR